MKLSNTLKAGAFVFISVFISGCGDDPKPVAPAEPATETGTETTNVEPEAVEKPETVVSSEDLEARAELMGFAKYIPGDFQTYVSIRPKNIHGKLKETRFFQWMAEDWDLAADDDPIDFFEDCEELVITTGNNTAVQTDVLFRVVSEFYQLTYLALYEQFAMEAGMMEPEDAKTGEYNSWTEAFPGELRSNFKEYVDVLETAQMPMTIMAARFSDKTDQIEEMLGEMEQMLIDGADTPLEVIKLDRSPTEQLLAFHLSFSNILDKESFLESVEEFELTDAQFERLYEVFTSKTFVFGFGKKEGYVVFFAGETVDHLQFAESLSDSLVSVKESAFFERYADKDVVYQQMATDPFTKTYSDLSPEPLKNYIAPMRDVLDRIDVLGDKRDLMAMLDGIESLGTEIYKTDGQPMVGAGYIEDGFKLEVKGGLSSSIVDYAAPSRFAALADDPSFAMVWTTNITEEGKTGVLEVEQLIVEFISAMSDRYFDMALVDEEQVEWYKFYKTELAGDLRKIWTAVKDEWAVGLGNEGVFLVDAQGAMPKFPVIPSAFASDANIPRMAIMYPVKDRERLQNSWAEIEPSLRKVIETVSKRTDAGFTLPDPSVTEVDDLRVYSYPVTGFTNDDFLPCMAVSDGYLVIGSSKVFAMELVEKMKSGEVKESPGGQYIDVNLSTLRGYGRDLIAVTRKHETLLEEDDVMRDFVTGIDDLEYFVD